MLLDCWYIAVGQLTSHTILITNETTVDHIEENTIIHFDSCNNTILFGDNLAESNAQKFKNLEDAGDATLVLKTCLSTGYLLVFINETEIGRAYGQTEATIKFSYTKGDVLIIQQFNASFAINGCGKLNNFYFPY